MHMHAEDTYVHSYIMLTKLIALSVVLYVAYNCALGAPGHTILIRTYM